MDLIPLNPVGDFIDREEPRRKSISNRVNKRILVLGLLLIVVVGLFVWQAFPFRQGYFTWLKSLFFGQELLLSTPSGLDLSEINLENLLPEEEPAFAEATAAKEEELVLVEEIQEREIIFEPKLAWIKKEIDEVAKEVEKIDKEVKKLKALAEIQDRIDEIAEKVAEIRTCLATAQQNLDSLRYKYI